MASIPQGNCTNSTNFSSTEPLPSTVSSGVWYIVTVAILLIGFLAFVSLFLVMLSTPRLRAGTGILIIHQLFSDLGTLCFLSCAVFDLPFLRFLQPSPDFNCTVYLDGCVFFIVVSNWNQLLLAFNRFVALLMPTKYKTYTKPSAIVASIVLCYCIAIPLTISAVVGDVIVGRTEDNNCGTLDPTSIKQTVTFLLCWVAPLLSAFLLYVVILIKSYGSRAKVQAAGRPIADGSADRTRQKRRLAMTRMLFVIFLFLLVTYLPTPITAFLVPWGASGIPREPESILYCLLISGYAASPVGCQLRRLEHQSN